MKLKRLFNKFFVSTFFLLLYCNQAHAEQLLFKAGDKASYTISQKVNLQESLLDKASYTQSEATIDLDICILSVNEETMSYPFDVEVTLKNIILNEVEQDGTSITTRHYDSNEAPKPENGLPNAQLGKLIDFPLNVRVGKDFDVQETTDTLTQIDQDWDSPLSVSLMGIVRLLLAQVFHLSGEDLQLSNSYPVSCYKFIDFEDEPLEQENIVIKQNSAYTILKMDSDRIAGTWNGEVKVDYPEEELEGEASLVCHVIWDKANPLMQQRDLSVTVIETTTYFFPYQIKASIHQTLTPRSCIQEFNAS